MLEEDAKTAATNAAELLLDGEVKPYLVSILRVSFLEGVAWAQEQRIKELRASVESLQEVAATNAN